MTTYIIWIAVAAAIFGFLWWQGHLKRFRVYWLETWEELEKCSWPTWAELKGSTVVVMISIFLLGAFTFVADQILFAVFLRVL